MSIIQTGIHYGYYLKVKQDKEENLETCVLTLHLENMREYSQRKMKVLTLYKAKGD